MRKVIEFDDALFEAMKAFAVESNQTLDALAHEACTLLLKKHCRPRNLAEALRMSLRKFAKNDNAAPKPQKRAR